MDVIVWFIKKEIGDDVTMASAVTADGVVALSVLTFSEIPVYAVQVKTSPQEFLEQLPEGVSACLYDDGLLSELEPENSTVQ